MKRSYTEIKNDPTQTHKQCEHCDCENSTLVRLDSLRGWICKVCDNSFDEVEKEDTKNCQLTYRK